MYTYRHGSMYFIQNAVSYKQTQFRKSFFMIFFHRANLLGNKNATCSELLNMTQHIGISVKPSDGTWTHFIEAEVQCTSLGNCRLNFLSPSAVLRHTPQRCNGDYTPQHCNALQYWWGSTVITPLVLGKSP